MTARTYITEEGYEHASVTSSYTREGIAEGIKFMAELYMRTHNPAAAIELSNRQFLAVKRYGYTWEEAEAIESAVYAS